MYDKNERNFDDLEKHYLYDLPEDMEYKAAEYICSICGSPIYDHFYEIDGDIVCQDCLEEMYMRYI